MLKPVRTRSRGSRIEVTFDLIAIRRAYYEGTLSDADRRAIERYFPGLLETFSKWRHLDAPIQAPKE